MAALGINIDGQDMGGSFAKKTVIYRKVIVEYASAACYFLLKIKANVNLVARLFKFLWRHTMSTLMLEAEVRADQGKGASRRLRRLENKVPAVLYGGDKDPQAIQLLQNKLSKALEVESIYSSVFDLRVNGKVERVILKDLQRHPYKPIILHMDLQRVSAKDVLVKMVPLHFSDAQDCPGVKEGGMVNHTMMQVEVRCQAQYLPEFISVDISSMKIDDVLHLSDLHLPKEVHFAIDPKTEGHDHPVVSIHMNKVSVTEEEAEVDETTSVAEEDAGAEDSEQSL
jgi:large subunit ribosomal protein L25